MQALAGMRGKLSDSYWNTVRSILREELKFLPCVAKFFLYSEFGPFLFAKAGKIVSKFSRNLLRACGRWRSGSLPKFEAVQNTPKKSGDDSRTPFGAMFCRLRQGNY